MNLNFSEFQLVFINVLRKIKCNYMSGLFCIVNLFEMGRKKNILIKFYGFSLPPNQNEVKHSYNKC